MWSRTSLGTASLGFVLLGDVDRDRVLLVVDAAEIQSRLDDDPWAPLQLLSTVSIDSWTIWLDGTQRGSGPSPARTSPVS